MYISGLLNFKKVASLLVKYYPALFDYKDSYKGQASKVGYGLGGMKGMKALPATLSQRVLDLFGLYGVY